MVWTLAIGPTLGVWLGVEVLNLLRVPRECLMLSAYIGFGFAVCTNATAYLYAPQ